MKQTLKDQGLFSTKETLKTAISIAKSKKKFKLLLLHI